MTKAKDAYDDITPSPSPSDEERAGGLWLSDQSGRPLGPTRREVANALATKGRDTAGEIAEWLDKEMLLSDHRIIEAILERWGK